MNEKIFMQFSKNAKISGENFYLEGDVIEVFSDKDENLSMNSTKDLSSVSQIKVIGQASFKESNYFGRGDNITLFPNTKVVIIEGNGEITDNQTGTVRGERLILDANAKSVKIDNGKNKRSAVSIDDSAIAKFYPSSIEKLPNKAAPVVKELASEENDSSSTSTASTK